jgi:hypothetical protein
MALFCLSLPLPLTFLRFQLGLYSGGGGSFSFFSPLLLFLFSCSSNLPLLLQLPDSTLKNVIRPFYCVSEESSKKKKSKFRVIYFFMSRSITYSSLALSSDTLVTLEPFRGLQATNSTSKIRVALFKVYKYLIKVDQDLHFYDSVKTTTKSVH